MRRRSHLRCTRRPRDTQCEVPDLLPRCCRERCDAGRQARDHAGAEVPACASGDRLQAIPTRGTALSRGRAVRRHRAPRPAPDRPEHERVTPHRVTGRARPRALPPRSPACAARAPSTRGRALAPGRRRRSPIAHMRTQASDLSTRRSAEPARALETRTARRPAGTSGSARVDRLHTTPTLDARRPHSVPGRRRRAHALNDGTRGAATTSCRLRIRSVTPRAARAGRPEQVAGRQAS